MSALVAVAGDVEPDELVGVFYASDLLPDMLTYHATWKRSAYLTSVMNKLTCGRRADGPRDLRSRCVRGHILVRWYIRRRGHESRGRSDDISSHRDNTIHRGCRRERIETIFQERRSTTTGMIGLSTAA